VIIAAPSGWQTFYLYSKHRPADWGSIWYFFEMNHVPLLGTGNIAALNVLSLGLFGVACVAIALLALRASRRPRLGQLCFLVLAAFLLTNKVWSPQYVIWLAPLVVLARPRIGAYLLWQAAEVGYFFAIWAYLITVSTAGALPAAAGGIGAGLYFAALLARFGSIVLLCVLVVREILRPAADVVRDEGEDDPAAGVLAGAPDRFVLPGRRGRPAAVGGSP
jgi:uncharacterized membrane protein